jgi:probable F420-dependent oxidoreductase
VLVTGDHFGPNFFGAIPALLAAALATTRLRVACTVFDNDFHHPASLAKDAATVDVLSGGRFEFGIGAGWFKAEYDQVGIPFDPPAQRVSRMAEALRVIKGMWGESPFTFTGQHYTISDYDSQPKPAQQPHPPIFVGGGGKRLLGIAAREADIVGISPRARTGGGIHFEEETQDMLSQQVEWLRQAAGERFDHLELGLLPWAVAVTEDRRAGAQAISQRRGRPVEEILRSPYYLIGTIDSIVDRLVEQREQVGISYISVYPQYTKAFAPVVARLAGR